MSDKNGKYTLSVTMWNETRDVFEAGAKRAGKGLARYIREDVARMVASATGQLVPRVPIIQPLQAAPRPVPRTMPPPPPPPRTHGLRANAFAPPAIPRPQTDVELMDQMAQSVVAAGKADSLLVALAKWESAMHRADAAVEGALEATGKAVEATRGK